MPNALQIAQGRQIPLSQGLIMALIAEANLLAAMDARTSASTQFTSLAIISLPTAGAFVNYNEGFTASEGGLELRTFDCSLVGGQIKAERLTADKWNREHAASGYNWFDLQTMLKMKAQGVALEKQIIQGTAYDAKGFPGLKELLPYVSGNLLAVTETAAKYNFGRTVLNAGGSTSNTGSSVYAIIEGEMDVQLILGDDMGGGSELFRLSEMVTSNEAPNPAEPTKKSLHDLQQFSGHIGLSMSGFNQTPNSVIPTQYSARRIANLTAQVGYTLNDPLMSKLSRMFGTSRRPTKFIMGTRSGEQLAASRQATAVNINLGAGPAVTQSFNTYPPPPTDWNGIPIVYTDTAIGEAEAIEA